MKPSTFALIFLLLGAGGPATLEAKSKTQPATKTTKKIPTKANPTTAKKPNKPKASATLPVAPYTLTGKAAEGLLAYTKGEHAKAVAALSEYRKGKPSDDVAYSLGRDLLRGLGGLDL